MATFAQRPGINCHIAFNLGNKGHDASRAYQQLANTRCSGAQIDTMGVTPAEMVALAAEAREMFATSFSHYMQHAFPQVGSQWTAIAGRVLGSHAMRMHAALVRK